MEDFFMSGKQLCSTNKITITGMLSAICVLLGITGLGYIPVPPFNSTIMHVPVIIGSILEGPVVGAMLGLIFGLTSMLQALKNSAGPVSFIFLNPIIALLPRILIGITPYYVYTSLHKLTEHIKLILAITVGTFTNTIGVLGMIYILYLDDYIKALGVSKTMANTTFLLLTLKGFISSALAIFVSLPIIKAVNSIYYKK